MPESAEMRWRESRPTEADNLDVGPATDTDLQSNLMEAPGNPFQSAFLFVWLRKLLGTSVDHPARLVSFSHSR